MFSDAIILINGEIDDIPVTRQRVRELADAIVIGVDGGSHHAETLGLKLNLVIGDMDSLGEQKLAALSETGIDLITARPEKDETDLELALIHAAQLKSQHMVLIGALGKRLDMALANIMLLLHPSLVGLKVEIWDGNQTAWVLRPPGQTISGQPGDTLSLLPLGGDANGIWLKGLAYPLKGESLCVGPARGVSNVFESDRAEIQFESGVLLVVHTTGRA